MGNEYGALAGSLSAPVTTSSVAWSSSARGFRDRCDLRLRARRILLQGEAEYFCLELLDRTRRHLLLLLLLLAERVLLRGEARGRRQCQSRGH